MKIKRFNESITTEDREKYLHKPQSMSFDPESDDVDLKNTKRSKEFYANKIGIYLKEMIDEYLDIKDENTLKEMYEDLVIMRNKYDLYQYRIADKGDPRLLHSYTTDNIVAAGGKMIRKSNANFIKDGYK